MKWLIIFLFNLIPLIGNSQTPTLNSIQKESLKNDTVKVVALLLAEHSQLSVENPILKNKIQALEKLNLICEESNKIKDQEIQLYQNEIDSNAIKINKLQKQKSNIIIGSSIGGLLLFIIGLIL